jgi:simple sugar transport system permease protein
VSGSAWIGPLGGHRRIHRLRLIHGFASISQRGNQIVSGVAINMLAAGLTAIVGNAWYGQGGRTPPLEGASASNRCLGHSAWSTWRSPRCRHLVRAGRTRFGLRLRAVGENPRRRTAGISSRPALHRRDPRRRPVRLAGTYLSLRHRRASCPT